MAMSGFLLRRKSGSQPASEYDPGAGREKSLLGSGLAHSQRRAFRMLRLLNEGVTCQDLQVTAFTRLAIHHLSSEPPRCGPTLGPDGFSPRMVNTHLACTTHGSDGAHE